jgi:hypothetical protein
MFARRREDVILTLRSGISIKKVTMTVLSTARHLVALHALPKGQKCNQEYFVQNILLSLRNEKKCFSRMKTAIDFSLRMDNSM